MQNNLFWRLKVLHLWEQRSRLCYPLFMKQTCNPCSSTGFAVKVLIRVCHRLPMARC